MRAGVSAAGPRLPDASERGAAVVLPQGTGQGVTHVLGVAPADRTEDGARVASASAADRRRPVPPCAALRGGTGPGAAPAARGNAPGAHSRTPRHRIGPCPGPGRQLPRTAGQ
ncbi:hypothetical protein GCM10010358_43580 [Streptomyces minutiscleroticus]|uniref:Uncharacterized protein n=1 Tax=Streptomyces minutiscleroticus TaxID=68238 RepID=A0A918U2K3_9ACTN|nr:hypothetical protein GCM10010358_43580 [Streptomyces minutiscleroticus]